MKSLIVYYSYTGNTAQVAKKLEELLRRRGEVDTFRLEALDEAESFFGQALRALFRRKARIKQVVQDFSGYDLICLGTPVWAFEPVPAMRTYLDNCTRVDGKRAILFATYGSGAGKERCLNRMEKALKAKGLGQASRFSIQQAKVKDGEFVEKVILKFCQV